MAVLLAGLPVTIPGATVNRLCGSGLEAVMDASRAVAVGEADVVLAGGVESMSRAPWVLPKPAKGYPTGHEQLWSTTLGWRMTNPRMPSEWTVSLGEGAELLADKYGISREQQDEFALGSHRKATAAWDGGSFAGEVVEVDGVELDRDESVRADTTLEKLATLRPVFRSAGTVTAGNASPMNDGSARAGPGLGGWCGPGRRDAAGPGGVTGHERRRAPPVRHRAGGGGADRAGAGRADLGGPGRR